MNVKKYFLTFGGPGRQYHRAVNRICKEAYKLDFFQTIIGKTDLDLKNDNEFWSMHQKFIEENKIGYGFWLWKSYLIKKQLEEMNFNDVLIYCDAGCQFNINGLDRLNEYVGLVNESEYGIIGFQMGLIEYMWTKMDTIIELDGLKESESGQLVGGIVILRKCDHTVDLVNKWYDFCKNYHLIDNSLSTAQNHKNFRAHRNDQSIFSILRKKYGCIILPDETYFLNWEEDGKKYPIWAKRYSNG
jgi:hypothetical protein